MASKGRFGSNSKSSVTRTSTSKFGSRTSAGRTKSRNATTPSRGSRTGKKSGAIGVGGPLAG